MGIYTNTHGTWATLRCDGCAVVSATAGPPALVLETAIAQGYKCAIPVPRKASKKRPNHEELYCTRCLGKKHLVPEKRSVYVEMTVIITRDPYLPEPGSEAPNDYKLKRKDRA